MNKPSVYAAKTNDRLPGFASEQLVEACNTNPEGKALAVHDKTQHVDRGGIWYPTVPAHGHKDAIIVFVEA